MVRVNDDLQIRNKLFLKHLLYTDSKIVQVQRFCASKEPVILTLIVQTRLVLSYFHNALLPSYLVR